MTGGWLEHEIRSYPQVLACSITNDDIVVLVQPSADPVSVERSITDLIRSRGLELPVRVFGGVRPVFVEPVKIRNGRPALVGSLGGALILAAGVWLAGSGVGLRGTTASRSPRSTELLVLAPPVLRELVTVPATGGSEEPKAPEPMSPHPILRPASRPPLLRPPARPEAPGPGPVAEVPTAADCDMPHEGEAVVPKNGRGFGPPFWSHSIHVPAHCDNGRPK